MRVGARPFLCAWALGLFGCSSGSMDLGPDPDVILWADHESPDLADWTGPGALRGSSATYGGGTLGSQVRTDAPSGGRVLQLNVPPHGGCCVGAYVYREGALPPEAFYGAAFRFATAQV